MKQKEHFSKNLLSEAEKLAKLITLNCVRNTCIEDFHAGKVPASKTGDYSDVKVVTPFGEIPWNELSRINDTEMKALNKEVVNKIYTFLLYLNSEDRIPTGSGGFWFPNEWDQAEVDSGVEATWKRGKVVNSPSG